MHVMLCHSMLGTAAPSTHLPRPTKPGLLVCLISGYVDQKYKASILTSLFKHCLHPHLTIHRLYPFKAPILVYTAQKTHSYKLTERLNSNETSQRKTLFLDRMWQFRFQFNELSKRYISVKTSQETSFYLLMQ